MYISLGQRKLLKLMSPLVENLKRLRFDSGTVKWHFFICYSYLSIKDAPPSMKQFSNSPNRTMWDKAFIKWMLLLRKNLFWTLYSYLYLHSWCVAFFTHCSVDQQMEILFVDHTDLLCFGTRYYCFKSLKPWNTDFGIVWSWKENFKQIIWSLSWEDLCIYIT